MTGNTIESQLPPRVRVNVRLCGSIPRKDLAEQLSSGGAPCPLLRLKSPGSNASYLAGTNGPAGERPTHRTIGLGEDIQPAHARITSQGETMWSDRGNMQHTPQPPRLTPLFEPPPWAVPARGVARLEPVCEAVDKQAAVDLTSRPYFRVGRSPYSDVQLLHCTSSRRHSLLFHHSNGSCYIVDCGSAHGTFVNGVRVRSPTRGVVVPHRVRRGSLIRFGGPGAPCFVLKSFNFDLAEISDKFPSSTPTTSPTPPELSKIVHLNTRINALGKTAAETFLRNLTNKKRLLAEKNVDRPCKRMRCSSPPVSPEKPIHLVSPDPPNPILKQRRVRFSDDPPHSFFPAFVTPERLPSDDENNSI